MNQMVAWVRGVWVCECVWLHNMDVIFYCYRLTANKCIWEQNWLYSLCDAYASMSVEIVYLCYWMRPQADGMHIMANATLLHALLTALMDNLLSG